MIWFPRRMDAISTTLRPCELGGSVPLPLPVANPSSLNHDLSCSVDDGDGEVG
ncbi:hypothetical protein BGW80DRAFT_1272413 [Lactifluus volemus]|nr:hypothetical protein BGW80DRAFT_1272413 [Lactifluus volemus]